MSIRFFSLLLLFMFIGCSSPRFVLDKDKVPFTEILKSIEQEQNKISSISGQSRISIDTKEFSGNFFADILYNENDSLLINVSGPFGIDVGKMFLGKNRFIFYNQLRTYIFEKIFRCSNILSRNIKVMNISLLFY